jgi:hypothetical protein
MIQKSYQANNLFFSKFKRSYFAVPSEFIKMRNSSKLKTLLIKYTISLDMGDDEIFKLMLTDKHNNNAQLFEGKSYSIVLAKAYSYLLQQLKNSPSP